MTDNKTVRRFDIIFEGNTVDGIAASEVKHNLQQLLAATETEIERLFSGQTIAIKENLDRQTATQLQQALMRAGAKIQLVLHRPSAATPVAAAEEADSWQSGHTSFEVMPAGTALSETSPTSTTIRTIDTQHLQTVEQTRSGAAIFEVQANINIRTESRYPGPSDMQLSNIELRNSWGLAEPGTLLAAVTPQAYSRIDTDHIELAKPIQNSADDVVSSVERPDTHNQITASTFSVTSLGADLLHPHEKKPTIEANIDTSQLSILD